VLESFDIGFLLLAWTGIILSGGFIGYITLISFAALFPLRTWKQAKREASASDSLSIAIVIPAHNESLLIKETVETAKKQDYPHQCFDIFVIADNCSDDTAEQARLAGANVIERHELPGKGQALHSMFLSLLEQDWDAFLVIDADCSLQGKALAAINREMNKGSRVIQLLDSISNPDINSRTRAMQLGMASFNGLRPRGRWNLGVSCGFFGNGFCLSRQVLEQVPYLAHSIVEDLEYHLLILEQGYKVQLVDDGIAAAQAPLDSSDSAVQRKRWEVGRALMIKNHAWPLLISGLKGRAWAWVALMEVIMPPASMIVLFTMLPLVFGSIEQRVIAFILLCLLGLHYFIASLYYGSVKNFFKICWYLPRYIMWKTLILIGSITKMNSLPWTRTDRHKRQSNDEQSK
jgi:1,2-diacylglycerol 3-beta-glucosyltransferase